MLVPGEHRVAQRQDWSEAPKAREGQRRMCPYSLAWEHALLAPLCWTFGLQNCERRNFCCFNPLNLWNLLQQHQTLMHPVSSGAEQG